MTTLKSESTTVCTIFIGFIIVSYILKLTHALYKTHEYKCKSEQRSTTS